MKKLVFAVLIASVSGCATITEDPMDPIAFSFSDGSAGSCHFSNKRGDWDADIPGTVSVRKSDDVLKYVCETKDGREAVGSVESKIGAKIVASAVFIDFGITDAITDKHRDYPTNFVIPVEPLDGATASEQENSAQVENRDDFFYQLDRLNDLKERGIITDEEFETQKKKILDSN